jgi:hypothetical protein
MRGALEPRRIGQAEGQIWIPYRNYNEADFITYRGQLD